MYKIIFFVSFFLFNVSFSAGVLEKSLDYDTNSNISTLFVPHAGKITYSYDPLNRLKEANYPNGETVKYTYDYNSNLIEITDIHGVTSYSFDALNRLVAAQFPDNSTVSYEYDLANRIVKITYPDKEEVKYNYDTRGRLTAVFDQTGITRYEYDGQTNLVIKECLPNGITTEYKYDSFPRVIEVSHKDSAGKLIVEYTFAYDNNDNCNRVIEKTTHQTTETTYSYDVLNRLVEAHYPNNKFEKYIYDGAGNRLAKTTQNGTIKYEYDIYNRLIEVGEARFYYDDSGNLTKKVSKDKEITFSYDSKGKLVSYFDGKNKVDFAYDGKGQRVSKTVNNNKTFFINDPVTSLSRVLLEKDEQGKTRKRYVYGFSRLFQQGPNGIYFFLYDQPGKSVSFLVDKSQRILESYNYNVFGVRSKKNSFENPYGYAGEEYDEETGLIYLRNRYYDPEIGRFITPDSVLGILGDPQTLNAYVYVRNNPVNYVDPSGLYGRLYVPLTVYANLPSADTPDGKSMVGHAWIGWAGSDCKPCTKGSWPEGLEFNETQRSLCAQTVYFTAWVTPEKQVEATQAMHRQHWTFWDNCVDHVLDALDAIGYPHPPAWRFTISSTGVSSAKYFYEWVKEEGNHVNPNFLPTNDDIIFPSDYFDPPKFRVGNQEHSLLFRPNYGGVSLSKTAELMTNISDITGAVFDQKTGQMILYGKKDLALPQMHLDDLAVAIRSVYGLGEKPQQDPGISMDPDPHPPKKHPQMIVTYYGETKNTRFGQVMFEADRLLKNLMVGRDNYTGKKFKAHVQGYHDLLELYSKEKKLPPSLASRMWFVPERISLVQSEDRSSMVFDQVRMQVLTESKFKGHNYYDHAAEKFATHFTQNYDGYAHEFPILHDLKRLGKITGIVKWIKEQGLPFDLSFFKSYAPQFVDTPAYTPKVADHEYRVFAIGGVTYHLDDKNFSAPTAWQANEAKEEVLRGRSREEELSWDFGRGYTAVAQTFAKSLKVGDVRKTFVDMSFPVMGTIPLALVRTYDSFNEQRSGFGLGWDVTPAKLRFPAEKRWFHFSDNIAHQIHTEIFVCLEGTEYLYKIVGLDTQKRPIYRTEGKTTLLLENADDTFSFFRKREQLLFNPEGKLIRISDKNAIAINYEYDAGRLVSISHQGKKAIRFEYEGPRIVRAIGLGGKVLYYDYTPEGQLKEVQDKEGILMGYAYDNDQHLIAIFDAGGNKIFEASYDIYNRAKEKIVNGTWLKQEFSLSERMARIEGDNSFFLEEQFDEKYRPQRIVDALGRNLELSYAGLFGPEKIVDNNGLEIFYEYDSAGHPIKIKDDYRGERKFTFDNQGNLLEETDGRGLTTAYRYDEKGRLVKIYRPFHLTFFSMKGQKVVKKGDKRFATTFHYDPTTGSLTSVDFPDGRKESFRLDENGLPLEICYSNGMVSKRAYDDRLRLREVSEMGRTLHYTYDERNRITKMTSPFGEVSYSYDQKGNILSKTDMLGLTSTFEYDESDNLIKVVDAIGGVSSYEYSSFGDLTKITLPNGSIREIRYDEFDRPIALK